MRLNLTVPRFRRGWTLQELIAPKKVQSLNAAWLTIGTKQSLQRILSITTGIDHSLLKGRAALSNYSVAQKMSWASHRQTTRTEDMAYCLFGIFDLNLPLLYGEGMKAFRRLQLEILRTTLDMSIFAWQFLDLEKDNMAMSQQEYDYIFDPNVNDLVLCGILAASPWEFRLCASIVNNEDDLPLEISITSVGIKIHKRLLLCPIKNTSPFQRSYVLPLGCSSGSYFTGIHV